MATKANGDTCRFCDCDTRSHTNLERYWELGVGGMALSSTCTMMHYPDSTDSFQSHMDEIHKRQYRYNYNVPFTLQAVTVTGVPRRQNCLPGRPILCYSHIQAV